MIQFWMWFFVAFPGSVAFKTLFLSFSRSKKRSVIKNNNKELINSLKKISIFLKFANWSFLSSRFQILIHISATGYLIPAPLRGGINFSSENLCGISFTWGINFRWSKNVWEINFLVKNYPQNPLIPPFDPSPYLKKFRLRRAKIPRNFRLRRAKIPKIFAYGELKPYFFSPAAS